jgi:hypothetical protein
MINKRDRILGTISIGNSHGLEIGPLTSPLVAKSEGCVLYVDYATTEIVRANQRDPAFNHSRTLWM